MITELQCYLSDDEMKQQMIARDYTLAAVPYVMLQCYKRRYPKAARKNRVVKKWSRRFSRKPWNTPVEFSL